MLSYISYVAVGLVAGIISGLIGIGGGVIIVPALVFLFGMTQHQAQGTSLAMLLPPIGLLAVLSYWKNGYINWTIAGLSAFGFFFGGLVGALFAGVLPEDILRKVFGLALLMISIYIVLS